MTFGDNGTIVDEVSRAETIKARANTLREIREKGFCIHHHCSNQVARRLSIRVVVRDTGTSRIGSATQFIEVPNLKNDRLTLSGILLQRFEPQSKSEQTVGEQKQFQSDEQRDIATRAFRAEMNLRFGYGIYNAKLDQATNSSQLTMQFKIFKDGKELFASKEKDVKLVEASDPRRLVAEGTLTLAKTIQPGDYVLQAIVRDSMAKGSDQATQWIDFEIIR